MPKLSSFILLIPMVLGLVACAPEYDKRKEGEAREKQKAAKEAAAKKKSDLPPQRPIDQLCAKKESDVPVSALARANEFTVDYRVNDPKKLNCDGSMKDFEQKVIESLRFIGDTIDLPLRSWPQGATSVSIESKRTCVPGKSTTADYNSSTQKLKVAVAQMPHTNAIFAIIATGRNVLTLTFKNAQGVVVESTEMLLNYHTHDAYESKALVAKEKRCKDEAKKKSN